MTTARAHPKGVHAAVEKMGTRMGTPNGYPEWVGWWVPLLNDHGYD
jgi:hypothetical protein